MTSGGIDEDRDGAGRGDDAVNWFAQGACASEDPELFFPVGTGEPAVRQIEDAKQVCRRCDVAEACLQWALQTGQNAGVWGGMSEDERRTLRRASSRRMAQYSEIAGRSRLAGSVER